MNNMYESLLAVFYPHHYFLFLITNTAPVNRMNAFIVVISKFAGLATG